MRTTQVNYALSGSNFSDGFIAGIYGIAVATTANQGAYYYGSLVYTTQVNYASLGSSCYNGFLNGFSIVSQTATTSRKDWDWGHKK